MFSSTAQIELLEGARSFPNAEASLTLNLRHHLPSYAIEEEEEEVESHVLGRQREGKREKCNKFACKAILLPVYEVQSWWLCKRREKNQKDFCNFIRGLILWPQRICQTRKIFKLNIFPWTCKMEKDLFTAWLSRKWIICVCCLLLFSGLCMEEEEQQHNTHVPTHILLKKSTHTPGLGARIFPEIGGGGGSDPRKKRW